VWLDKTYILPPVAQRRHLDLHHPQAIVEVRAEPSLAHPLLEGLIGRSDDTDIHFAVPKSPQSPNRLVLQQLEQLALNCDVDLPDLVQKKRAAVRRLHEPELALARIGEGTPLVAEQLGLEKVRRDGRAVQLDEGVLAARSVEMYGPRNEFLAGSGLAGNQDRRRSRAVERRFCPDYLRNLLSEDRQGA
jgi:hypothetical protein